MVLCYSSPEKLRDQETPWWSSGEDFTFQCKGCRFEPWSGSFPGGSDSKESACNVALKVKVTQSCPTICDPMDYIPWNSPGQNTGVGSLSLLQGIFPTQGLNSGLLHCRRILYQLSHKGSPRILDWVAYPFSSGSSQPRKRTGVSCTPGGFFTNWAIRDPGSIPGLGRYPGERNWQSTPIFLPGKFHGQRSLMGYSPWGHKESDTTEQLHTHTHGTKKLSPSIKKKNKKTTVTHPYHGPTAPSPVPREHPQKTQNINSSACCPAS